MGEVYRARLNHPNIAAIYGIEGHALVMELVEGKDLSEMIGALETQGAPRTTGMPLSDALPITLASVLKEDVSWQALPSDLPVPIRRLLRRCLEIVAPLDAARGVVLHEMLSGQHLFLDDSRLRAR